MTKPIESRPLNEKEVAEYFGVSLRTVRHWRFHGVGPAFFRVGDPETGNIRYRIEDLDAYARERRIGGGA